MIYTTAVASLSAQFIIGVIDYLALNTDVNPKDEILKDLLKVELGVQIVEFIFYVWLLLYFSKVSHNITPFRYLDWSITTPLMLITLSGFLNHDETRTERLWEFLYNNAGSIIKIVALNAAMLFFGFMGEIGLLNPYLSTALGFIPFAINFKDIKEKFLPSSEDNFKNSLFYWFLIFWSLYGLFAVMNYTTKNVGYTILDIFSKNILGLFLAYIVWSKSKNEGNN